MVKLPEKFSERMKEMLGDEAFGEYVASFEKPARSGVRINTLKLNVDEWEKISPFEGKRVPWLDNAFFYGKEDNPSKHPYYYAGMYYIQEPSAMTPAALFDVKPGDKVLDLCAAPGGKSTALAAKLKGEGLLVCNDISNSRAKALLKNIELFGVKNALVLSESPERLLPVFTGFFDKIIVDAPCSGEGMFRKQHSIMSNWEQYGTGYYAKLQKDILALAVKMLKPGGRLLYSTCTFSPEEDEEQVANLIRTNEKLSIKPLVPEEKREYYESLGFTWGRSEWMKEQLAGIENAVRLFPHLIEGEGHFMALIEKSESESFFAGNNPIKKRIKLPAELKEFLDFSGLDYDEENIVIRNERVYLYPDDLPAIDGLRVLRCGLLLGELKKDRFEPSQALACALDAAKYPYTVSLPSDDMRVVKYLKCESIELPEADFDGYALIAVDGYPLGFAKVKKGNFKNKYLPGWRMM